MDATFPPQLDEPPGRLIAGRWRIGALLGRGTFGTVWRAADVATGAAVAVKLLDPETSVDVARVRKEIAALRLLRVPGVVELLEAGTDAGRHYLVMELVDGLPFPGRARGWEALAPIVGRLCETLRQIHARGVVHRDLKPQNVLVTDEGRVVVLDFGIARGAALGTTVTGTSEVVGTPLYLAPEQIHRDAPVDGRADLYALGLLIFEALAERRPFSGRTAQELMVARLTREAPPLDARGVPEVVVSLVRRLLARSPDQRPSSADVVLAALNAGEVVALPWLGSRAVVDVVVDAVRAGRSVDVWGPPGSGKSRVVAEVVAALGVGTGVDPGGAPGAGNPGADLPSAVDRRQAETGVGGGVVPEGVAVAETRTDRSGAPEVVSACRPPPATGSGAAAAACRRGDVGESPPRVSERGEGSYGSAPGPEAPNAFPVRTEVVALVPADRPLGSLAPLVGALGDEAPMVAAEARVREALAGGVVVVADDYARLDRWTRALLERVRGAGVVVRVADTPAAVRLSVLEEGDLWDLFHGPDVVLHLREDAAKAMYARTGGVPARVAEEVRGWVARGDARWDEGRLRVDRRAIDAFAAAPAPVFGGRSAQGLEEPLDELLAWIVLAGGVTPDVLAAATGLPGWEIDVELGALEDAAAARRLPDGRLQALTLPRALGLWSDEQRAAAHRRLAAALPEGSHERLVHLVAAGSEEVEGAALTFARAALETGAAGKALAGLTFAIGEGAASSEVLETLARAALVDGSGPALREARLTLERARAGELARLVAGWEAAGERRYSECSVGGGPFVDEELEAWRVALPIRVAVATDLELAERLIGELEGVGGVIGRRRVEWLGHLRFRQGRYSEAAELHMEAARNETGVARRANALINAGLAWLDGGVLNQAKRSFDEARELAEKGRIAVLEGYAAVGARRVEKEAAEPTPPAHDLLDALRGLAHGPVLAQALMNEAVMAWRSHDCTVAARLAREAADLWGTPGTEWLRAVALGMASMAQRSGRWEGLTESDVRRILRLEESC